MFGLGFCGGRDLGRWLFLDLPLIRRWTWGLALTWKRALGLRSCVLGSGTVVGAGVVSFGN